MKRSSVDITGSGSRREFLLGAAGAIAGSFLPIRKVHAANYAAGDVRKWALVANRPEAADANTAALRSLVAPGGTFSGDLFFPNVSGSDIYHFNDFIPFHDGIHVDLRGSTLSFAKAESSSRDSYSGFLHAMRDFSLRNGSIVVQYATNAARSGNGNALAFGARGSATALFAKQYDARLARPMGNIVVNNVRIASNAGGGLAILMIGGLDGVTLEDVGIDGQGQLLRGVNYEFGWATDEAKPYQRQTSHARNVRVKNLTVRNVLREAFTANGAQEVSIDGMKVSGAAGVCAFGPGESLYYRPWLGVERRRTVPQILIRNVEADSISGAAIVMTGASRVSSSYLDDPPAHDNPNGLTADQMTDLLDFTLDGFTISGDARGWGVSTSARQAVIRNGTLRGFQRGIVTTQECTKFLIDSVKVLDSASIGIQIGQAVTLHHPPRFAAGQISNCFIAGSGSNGPSPAIAVATTRSCVIENCRFGYEMARDGKEETSQSQAGAVAADASGVVCRRNHVGGTAHGAVAYRLMGAGSRQCRLEDNDGVTTASGRWLKSDS